MTAKITHGGKKQNSIEPKDEERTFELIKIN